MSYLEIKVDGRKSSIILGGDMAEIAREIGHLALGDDEFALAINCAMLPVNEQITAKRLRDEMIGMIKNP